MTLHSNLEKAFNSEAVAIIGVSGREKPLHPGYTGLRFLRMLKSSGFRGRIYPINSKVSEIEGAKVYPSLSSVPPCHKAGRSYRTMITRYCGASSPRNSATHISVMQFRGIPWE